METQSKPSAGALKVAESLNDTLGYDLLIDDEITKLAALIDAALAELVKAARTSQHELLWLGGSFRNTSNSAEITKHSPALQALEKALAPWEPESGGGE